MILANEDDAPLRNQAVDQSDFDESFAEPFTTLE